MGAERCAGVKKRREKVSVLEELTALQQKRTTCLGTCIWDQTQKKVRERLSGTLMPDRWERHSATQAGPF